MLCGEEVGNNECLFARLQLHDNAIYSRKFKNENIIDNNADGNNQCISRPLPLCSQKKVNQETKSMKKDASMRTPGESHCYKRSEKGEDENEEGGGVPLIAGYGSIDLHTAGGGR
jgi:hypothetical protein